MTSLNKIKKMNAQIESIRQRIENFEQEFPDRNDEIKLLRILLADRIEAQNKLIGLYKQLTDLHS